MFLWIFLGNVLNIVGLIWDGEGKYKFFFRLFSFFFDLECWFCWVFWGENFGNGGSLFFLCWGFFGIDWLWFFFVFLIMFGKVVGLVIFWWLFVCGFIKLNSDFEFLVEVFVFLRVNLLIWIFIFCIFFGVIFSCFRSVWYCLVMICVLFVMVGKV